MLGDLKAHTGRLGTDEAGADGNAKFKAAAEAIETLYQKRLGDYLEYRHSPGNFGSGGTVRISAEGKKVLSGARREKNLHDLHAIATLSPGKITERKAVDKQIRSDAALALQAAETPRKLGLKKLREAVMAHPLFAMTGIAGHKLVPVMDHPATNEKVLAHWNPDTGKFDRTTPAPQHASWGDSNIDIAQLTDARPERVLNLSLENPNKCSILRG